MLYVQECAELVRWSGMTGEAGTKFIAHRVTRMGFRFSF
jgi:hypothetical protein